MKALQVDLKNQIRSWSPPAADIAAWAGAALGRHARGREVGVLVVGSRESRRLNARYRGCDHPTNVLSFPAAALPAMGRGAAAVPLGDLVVCPPILRIEARRAHKSLRAHWAHLVVHGSLHLLGYDHERAPDARRMEQREIRVLKSLGFPNPYRSA